MKNRRPFLCDISVLINAGHINLALFDFFDYDGLYSFQKAGLYHMRFNGIGIIGHEKGIGKVIVA